jgi:hypothetical protein
VEKQATLWRNKLHCGEKGYIVEKQATLWRNRLHCGETSNIVEKQATLCTRHGAKTNRTKNITPNTEKMSKMSPRPSKQNREKKKIYTKRKKSLDI